LKDPSRTAFFFGGQDIIIDAARARKYLERRKCTSFCRYSARRPACVDDGIGYKSVLQLTPDGVRAGMHWDETGGHGDGLAGESLMRVINYVGTGSAMGLGR